MVSKLDSFLSLLKGCIDSKRNFKAKEYLESISKYFDDDLLPAETEYAVETLFNASNGTIAFLNKSFNCSGTFKACNVEIFMLFRKLIPKYQTLVKRSANVILKCALKYVQSSSMSARERELACLVLQDLIVYKVEDEDMNRTELIYELIIVFEQKKHPNRFQQNMYELLGLLAKEHPENMVQDFPCKVRDILLNAAELQLLKAENPCFTSLAGAIQGLNYFLVNFAPIADKEPMLCQRIYVVVKKLSDWGSLTEKAAFRNSMNLLAEHGSIMTRQLFVDYKYWQQILTTKWMQSVWEDRRAGIYAIHSFHREVSNAIGSDEEMSEENKFEILNYFMKYFKNILQLSTSRSYEIRIAIRGFGVMAGPCKKILQPEYLNDLLSLVMQRTEYTYLTEDKGTKSDLLEHLPDFVQALSQIMNHVTELSGIQLCSLQNIIIALMKDFHYLSASHHDLVVHSLMTTFNNLYNLGGGILDNLLEKVILKGIIWTCSHKLAFDANQEWDTIQNWKENVTYKNYLPLWKGLLSATGRCTFERTIIIQKNYQHLIKSLFIILDKLDFSTTKRTFKDEAGEDQEFYFCDPNIDLNPVKPKDFHIFFNLVDFFGALLKDEMDLSQQFEEWIPVYCEVMIKKAIKYPLVSGFVKLLELGLVIADRLNYFADNFHVERKSVFGFVAYFLEMMISKSQRVTGELQIACLKFVLSSPASLLNHFVTDHDALTTVFKTAFDIGKGMIWLANLALTCLQRLLDTHTLELQEHRESILQKVLPSLDTYLQTHDSLSATKLNPKLVKFQKKRSTAYKKLRTNYSAGNESELSKFQMRILAFLGTLEPNLCVKLLDLNSGEREDDENYRLVKWDLAESIKLTLLCGSGIKPTIYLDTITARVCELAVKSSDRRTKISACELLHAIILYMIGTNNHNGKQKLWLELCKHLLLLSCDSDIAVQQMFEPLLIQIIHYLSQPSQLLSKGTDILITCLMDSISHRSNTSIRDISARCIREFMLWTTKQVASDQQQASPANMKRMIIILKMFCLDSDPNKRQGAALAFNNIYRILREEEHQIECIWFDIFYAFNINFIMSEELDESTTNLEQVSASIDHLVRVLIVRKDLFNTPNDKRLVPKGFHGSLLKDLVFWVFEKCASKQSQYRHKSMEVFVTTSVAVANINEPRDFITKFVSGQKIIETFEHFGSRFGIKEWDELKNLTTLKISLTSAVCTWMEYFLATLDAYVWLFRINLIESLDFILRESNVFIVVEYFLTNVAAASMQMLLTQLNPNFGETLSVERVLKYNTIKCTMLVRAIDLMNTILPQNLSHKIPQQLWSNAHVVDFIVNLIFQPQSMGFDFKSCQETIVKLPKKVEELLDNINKFNHHLEFKRKLFEQIAEELKRRFKETVDAAESYLSAETIRLEELNAAKGILMITNKMDSFLTHFPINYRDNLEVDSVKLLQDLFSGIQQQKLDGVYQIQPLPTVRKYGNILIQICFNISAAKILDTLIAMLLSDTKLKIMASKSEKCSINHGEHFVSIYKESIFDFINKTIPDSIVKIIESINRDNFVIIITFLSNFMEQNYNKKKVDVALLKLVTELILRSWVHIYEKSNELDNTLVSVDLFLIELMSHVAMASPIQLNQLGRKAEGYEKWINELLTNSKVSLDIKSKAIFLIPTIIGADDFENANLSASLRTLQNNHFPLNSSEFAPNSLERASFVTTINSILDAMIVSKSPVLLKSIIDATAADPKHIAEQNIREKLCDFIRLQNSNQQNYNLKIIFNKFSETTLEPTIRLTIMRRFLVTMLRVCRSDAIITFFKENIKKIIGLITSNYGSFSGQGWEVEQALVNRAGGYQLIELYVSVLPRDKILIENCPVARAMIGGDVTLSGNRLISEITKKAHGTRSEVFITTDAVAAELFRKYQCCAYKALCAIISNMKDEIQFYGVLLFRENSEKNEYIWQKMINCTDAHIYDSFSQEYEDHPKIKDKIVSVRQLSSSSGRSLQNKFQYIQTTSVFQSSLSQDVTKLDLNSSVVRTSQEVAELETMELLSREQRNSTIRLEKSSINDHEVMAVLCAVIQHMYDNKITPVSTNPNTPAPQWVKFIASSLMNQQRHKNVRLFLAKLVDNCRHVFKHYAAALLAPIMQVIVDECISSTMNSFITDLAVMILDWGEFYLPKSCDEISLASSLMKFMMKNCYHVKKDIFRLNLEIIKNLMELWKGVINVPIQLIFDAINVSKDPESVANLCGLQLNAIVMANGLLPWTDMIKVDFIRAVFNCLDNERTSVYQPASELVGMCLSVLYPKGEDNDDDPCLKELVGKLWKIQKLKEKKFMDIVYGIHKNFPYIVDTFLVVISHNIPTAIGIFKRVYLEMLLARVEAFHEHIYRELMSLDLQNLLKQTEFQLTSLHILNKSLPMLNAEQISGLIEDVCAFSSSGNSSCRDVMYEILIFIHEHFRDLPTDLSKKVIQVLLKGLNDADSNIQNRIFEFWTDEKQIPKDIDDRFLELLKRMYDPALEKEFLGYTTQLLLESAIKNPESKRQVFQHESETDSKLTEYQIDISWRQHNSVAVAPLFVESQQKQLIAGDGSQMMKLLKATQADDDNFFEPTQDPIKMTQTQQTFTLPSQNSLLFNVNPPILDRRSRKTKPNEMTNATKNYEYLRKRFLKDKEKSQREQAFRAIERHSYERVRTAESKKMKEGHVVLYRRYRIGDFPDLLINSLALLMPLQALCKRDSILARQIFVSIFVAVVAEMEAQEKDSRIFILGINDALQTILKETKNCEPLVFGALMEICLSKPKIFDLNPENVAAVANATNMMTIGTLYMENKLNFLDMDTISIKTRTSSIDVECLHWLKLSELFHSLNEFDVMSAIFADKVETSPELGTAIDLESSGDFVTALRKYWEVITSTHCKITEQNYCYQSYYNCYMQMGMWDELVGIIGQQFEDHEELWTDDWNQENLLPNLIHGELRLILADEGNRSRNFVNIMEMWLRAPEKSDYVKLNFGEELTMLHIANREYTNASVYSEQVLKQFLSEWSHLSILSDKLRSKRLLTARKVAELHNYTKIFSTLNDQNLQSLHQNWNNSSPEKADSLVLWDCIVAYRQFILKQIEDHFNDTESNVFVKKLGDSLFNLDFKLLDVAYSQNNISLTDRILTRTSYVCNEPASEQDLKWKIGRYKNQRLKGAKKGNESGLNRMVSSFRKLNEVLETESLGQFPEIRIKALNEAADFCQSILTVLPQMVVQDDVKQTLKQLVQSNNSDNLVERLHKHSLWCLKESVKDYRMESAEMTERDTKVLADSYFKIAQFCYDNYEKECIDDTIEIEKEMTISLLRSMQFNSKEGRQLFPCLLQLPSLANNSLVNLFKEESASIPEWAFLKWIPQILSHLDFNQSSFLEDIVIRLATSYPVALTYSFRLSYQQYKAGKNVVQSEFVSKLLELLQNPLLDKFIHGISCIALPEYLLLFQVQEIFVKICNMNNQLFTNKQFQECVQEAIKVLYPSTSSMQGKYYQKIEPYKQKLLSLLEMHLTRQYDEVVLFFQTFLKDLRSSMPKITRISLSNLCPWLASYQFCGQEEYLEIPGQYDNVDYRPHFNNNVKIVKFDSGALTIFETLRRPIRITMHGSDGKIYDFLVKCGEDLRQDQRIQQSLMLISNQLKLDKNCSNHSLAITTYKVLPISQHVGLISWVKNTDSLRNIVYNALPRYCADSRQIISSIRIQYQEFLEFPVVREGGNSANKYELYGRAASYYDVTKVKLNYNEMQYKIPNDLLKRALYDFSVSPECFYTLRNNFAKSLASMSIAHWILGIGDRHLSNNLMNVSTGHLVGIDFGVSFGSGTRDLQIPEMIPFRMTPHLVSVMEPLGVSGLIGKCMSHTLRSLRNSKKLLKACLEVFVKEPTLNWLEAAKHKYNQDDTKIQLNWDAVARINIVVRKLNGANPKIITAEELNMGYVASNKDYLNGYLKLLQVDKIKLPDSNLTVEQQVACLIDMATDGAILGITFEGWSPWM